MSPRTSNRATLQEEARALGDPTRHAIFRLLVDSDEPLGVTEITARFDLNHNAIRQHLAKLIDAGLVDEARSEARGPGRPRHVYSVSPTVAGRWDAVNPYESLSRLLAEVITSGDDPESVGRRSGQRLAAEARSIPGDPLASLLQVMARQGFEPDLSDGAESDDSTAEIVLHHCPFAVTAADAREAVCSLHLGLADGLAEHADLHVSELVAGDPGSGECRLRLGVGETVDERSGRLILGSSITRRR